MEDGFHLAEAYKGAYRARLNANLAFWDGLDGKVDWPVNGDGHPLTELWLADYLVVDASRPYVEKGSFLRSSAQRARSGRTRRAAVDVERRCDGYVLHVHYHRRERRTRT